MNPKGVQEWITKAEEDYQTVLILSRQRKNFLPDSICFHAHQFAEKYLKALLAQNNLTTPKTHDLIFLLDQLKEVESELELNRDILRDMNRYAVESRYPGEKASIQEAKTAIKYIKELHKIFSNKF